MSGFLETLSFREKSLWVQVAVMVVLGNWYYARVGSSLFGNMPGREETLGIFFGMTITLVVLSVIAHIILAVVSPKEANAPADERDRQIADRAGNYASYMLGGGVIMIAIYSVINSTSAITMAHLLVLLLIVVDILTNALQILYYRRGY